MRGGWFVIVSCRKNKRRSYEKNRKENVDLKFNPFDAPSPSCFHSTTTKLPPKLDETANNYFSFFFLCKSTSRKEGQRMIARHKRKTKDRK